MDKDTLLSLLLLRGIPLTNKEIYDSMEILNIDNYKSSTSRKAGISLILSELRADNYIKSTGRGRLKCFSLTEEGVKYLAQKKIEGLILRHITKEVLRHGIK